MSTFEENLDDIYKYDTESLIEFLRNNIQIKEEYFDILRDQEITGSIFFKITEETFRSYGLKGGFIQNVIQCESALQTNRKKRKAGVAFWDCEYLYGAITTATDWYFLSYKEESDLKKKVKQVLEIIAGLLKDSGLIDKKNSIFNCNQFVLDSLNPNDFWTSDAVLVNCPNADQNCYYLNELLAPCNRKLDFSKIFHYKNKGVGVDANFIFDVSCACTKEFYDTLVACGQLCKFPVDPPIKYESECKIAKQPVDLDGLWRK
ncbi:10848_t:CDS:2 [Rhizophagus irregularis]|nr:10848_t:CDS:2 [Rhizophagus irregularis]